MTRATESGRANGERKGRIHLPPTWLPMSGLAIAIVVAAWMSRAALGAAAAGEAAHGREWLYALAALFLLAMGAVQLVQGARFAARVVGPEARLIESLRRMRGGDLSFRVHLRRDDLLTGLANECNEVLEWLNANPPRGASTGTDVVEVEKMEVEAVELLS